ncbi:SAC3/GANP family protein [Dictyocaulus viviparus]|uniref:Eukaryotic translation initiation factor 3 subunit K n=1 Tax=Dictyocaulus viviparus TaxID=29172 RepID=A0A0D8Y5M6_DICVI|nr:SAC3/GANP family protein [Dictyocaulus viviparus]
MMQAIQISAPFLSSVNLDIDYRGHKTADHDKSPLDGKVTCGICEDGRSSGAYVLTIDSRGVEITASDYCGIRYAFATFVQILRLRKCPPSHLFSFVSHHTNDGISSNVSRTSPRSNSVKQLSDSVTSVNGYSLGDNLIPCMTVRDSPDLPFRAVFQDFSGCRILNTETLLQLATRISYCKANYLFVNFEVRTTDRYQLPYTNRNLFHMMQVCEELFVTLSSVPSYVTLCVEGCFPFDADKLLSPRVSIVLKFSTGDDGYLCAAPESTAKKAVLASRLSGKCNVLGTMVCDLSTGCEAMPPSLSYMTLLSILGVAWNGMCDVKKFVFLQPAVAAHHILMDGEMVELFNQVATLGRVEHELTKVACGILRPTAANSPICAEGKLQVSGFGQNKKMPLSVFVEMILNPEALNLEHLTPVIFKRARIELRRSLMALDEARKSLPYNFELALVLAEIKLVTELMVLISRLGQALCIHGLKHFQGKNHEEGFYSSFGRVGVAHLPLTVRTDFANRLFVCIMYICTCFNVDIINSLLEIRSQFQHVWLSRSIPSTLPNALKMFDNLFRYNPENVADLTKCVQLMATENKYDRDIVLTILKLYQLNPDKFDEGVVRLVLLKTLMVLPRSDFALAKCLIDSSRLGSQELQRVLDLGTVLEACDFAVFWSLVKGEYKPSTDVSEPFKVPQEVPRMIKAVTGFEEAVRAYACRVISVTFQNIEKSMLSRLLGGATDKQVAEYAKRFGWEETSDNVYFIANHEATIRTRNIDEKLQFSIEFSTLTSLPILFCFDYVADILRNMPGIPVMES